jgi:hypothetical protein
LQASHPGPTIRSGGASRFVPSEALVPLRIPTAQERIDPPLVDIYVPDGRRTGDLREAQVIVAEVLRIIESPGLSRIGDGDRWRSINVISLIGSKQAALINRMLLEALGEETVLRHRISCGDSATFQGNERDIVFLSMVAIQLASRPRPPSTSNSGSTSRCRAPATACISCGQFARRN